MFVGAGMFECVHSCLGVTWGVQHLHMKACLLQLIDDNTIGISYYDTVIAQLSGLITVG